ncbi:hypothetical protein [Nannocystis pusilla]|uniref:Uncharacterized protein n=1 Tax=Nannocystis pusilla TaxID=889268 RepID=A0ABS7TJ22_9BACT|nr:hypothetical protein [Nannocystis pusilla]MBZ5708225.1 hypothetical protein [Nannocystis pusilla]
MKVLEVIWAILRGLFWGIVDDYPFGDSAGPTAASKESPWWEDKAPPPPKEPTANPAATNPAASGEPPASKATTPGWWAAPAPPATPPTIKVETDAGTFIAATTFSGPNLMGIRRVERPRQEGESRRRRRSVTPAAPASPVTHSSDVELQAREPAVPQEVASEGAEVRPCAPAVPTRIRPREPAIPDNASAPVHAEPRQRGGDVAVPIEAVDMPRVARARRVRSRLGGMPQLATTLATRLALAASTQSSPAPVAVREGA